MFINRDAAKALGITVPQALLLRAAPGHRVRNARPTRPAPPRSSGIRQVLHAPYDRALWALRSAISE
jgi:hypothetical protein